MQTEPITLARRAPMPSFAELRQFALNDPVAHACIEFRASEIRATGWDIVPSERQSVPVFHGLPERRRTAVQFFRKPDPDYVTFDSWVRAIVKEVLTTDALAIYKRPAIRPSYGRLNDDVAALCMVDGAVIEPVLNTSMRIIGHHHFPYDVDRRSAFEVLAHPSAGPLAVYGPRDLVAPVFGSRNWTTFGHSPIERALERRSDDPPGLTQDERTLKAFGIHPATLGMTAQPWDDLVDQGKLRRDLLAWLADVFTRLIHDPALHWKWEAEG